MDSDVVGKSSEYFIARQPDKQVEEHDKEKGEVLDSMPIIQKVIDSLNESIAHHESINAFSDEVFENPTEFMHQVAGNKRAVAVLKSERSKLISLVKEYTDDDE